MVEIKTRAKFGSNKQGTQSQATADKAPELDVKEQATSNNEVSNTGKPEAVSQNDEAKPDAQTQLEVNDKPAHQNASSTYNLSLKLEPRKKSETKTRRVQAVFKPSTYERLAALAKRNDYSINDLLNKLVEAYLSQQEI